jgi:hypothetical protein
LHGEGLLIPAVETFPGVVRDDQGIAVAREFWTDLISRALLGPDAGGRAEGAQRQGKQG